MDSKSKILDNIRRNSPQAEPYPDIEHFVAVTYPDKVEQFIQMVAAVGGRAEVLAPDADIAATIQALYPEATRFISNLELPGLPVTHPKEVATAEAMNGTDVTILASPLGVCENACLWVEQTEEWRAQFFISENLVFIVERTALVNNMHEAYKKVEEMAPSTPYSGFISGPSKTADIEQALVMGAHGARGVVVLIR